MEHCLWNNCCRAEVQSIEARTQTDAARQSWRLSLKRYLPDLSTQWSKDGEGRNDTSKMLNFRKYDYPIPYYGYSEMTAKRRKPSKIDPGAGAIEVAPNPPRGERKDFVKVTVTLAPELYKLLADEAARRKMNKEPNPILSAIVREAVQDFMTRRVSGAGMKT
jgi:hypothetical protein